MTLARWLIAVAFYAGLLGIGWMLSHVLADEAKTLAPPGEMLKLNMMVISVLAIYVVASALPFVPGAEIGLVLIGAFGAAAAIPVYVCMVLALCLAYGFGRLTPPEALARGFAFLNLKKSAELVRQTASLPPDKRMDHLLGRSRHPMVQRLLECRYVALGIAFNVPGNSLLGGGGGLALLSGLSRLFAPQWFLLTTLLAVAPIPAAFLLMAYLG